MFSHKEREYTDLLQYTCINGLCKICDPRECEIYFYHIYDDIFISRHLGNFKKSEKKITAETFSFY